LAGAQRFLKLDGKRLGRDIELYGFMGNDVAGWEQTLAMFFAEVLLPLRDKLPKSYSEASAALRKLGGSVYPKHLIQRWNDLFKG